jgi:hypothetical protein
MTQSMVSNSKGNKLMNNFFKHHKSWSWCRRGICKVQRCDEKHGYIVESIIKDKKKVIKEKLKG